LRSFIAPGHGLTPVQLLTSCGRLAQQRLLSPKSSIENSPAPEVIRLFSMLVWRRGLIQGAGNPLLSRDTHRLAEQKAVILGTMLHVPESQMWRTAAFAWRGKG